MLKCLYYHISLCSETLACAQQCPDEGCTCVAQTALQLDHVKTFWRGYTPESTSQGLTQTEDQLLSSLQARQRPPCLSVRTIMLDLQLT